MAVRLDPAKAVANLRKHGVSLADAEGVLFDPLALTVEDRDARDERRLVTIGIGSAGELLVRCLQRARRRHPADFSSTADCEGAQRV